MNRQWSDLILVDYLTEREGENVARGGVGTITDYLRTTVAPQLEGERQVADLEEAIEHLDAGDWDKAGEALQMIELGLFPQWVTS